MILWNHKHLSHKTFFSSKPNFPSQNLEVYLHEGKIKKYYTNIMIF